MAIQFMTSDQAAQLNGIKALIYGVAGAGKTTLVTTAPTPFLISAEAGELSLRKFQIPMARVSSMADLNELAQWLSAAPDAQQFKTIFLDSISEIAEVCLANAKRTVKDPRMGYAKLGEDMEQIIRFFRDLPGRNVVFVAKQESVKDEVSGMSMYGPSMPGNKLGQKLPYYFDMVFRLGVNKDQKGDIYRFLQCQPDAQYQAKDRSGALGMMEEPNLTTVFQKILAAQ